jgi:thiazole synthase ThiGH ThiG subunit
MSQVFILNPAIVKQHNKRVLAEFATVAVERGRHAELAKHLARSQYEGGQ